VVLEVLVAEAVGVISSFEPEVEEVVVVLEGALSLSTADDL
jgi:hypothetical protein